MVEFSQDIGLTGLALSSFLSATLLPGNSEVALLVFLHRYPDAWLPAILVATTGNTLGGMTSYLLGRLLPSRVEARAGRRAIEHLRRYGPWALLLSWLPVIGEALCLGAGWLRFNGWISLLLIGTGKLFRYAVLAGGWSWLAAIFSN